MELTVIIPMHNEEKNAAACIGRVQKACKALTASYEIIIAEDGSSDNTYGVIKRAARGNPRIMIMHSAGKLGRGRALTAALRKARGDVSVYMDADLASNLGHLGELVSSVKHGAVIATGSRLLPSSRTRRGLKREVASRGYNLLVRTVLGSKLHDHQCGFKAFRTKAILPLLGEVEDTHWFWDTEILVRAQRKGMRVDEIPIGWEEGRGTTVRLKNDVLYMGRKILHLKRRMG